MKKNDEKTWRFTSTTDATLDMIRENVAAADGELVEHLLGRPHVLLIRGDEAHFDAIRDAAESLGAEYAPETEPVQGSRPVDSGVVLVPH